MKIAEKKLTWLHVSDFHFGKKNSFEQEFSASKLISHLSDQKERGVIPHLIFITGDIANSGMPAEYEMFNKAIVSQLKIIYGDEIGERIFTVPGNHDLQRDVNSGFSREKFRKIDSGAFLPTDESLKKRKMLIDRFEGYIFGAGQDAAIGFSENPGTFTEIRNICGEHIAITGINTAWLCEGDEDRGNLTPGLQIIRSALEKTRGNSVKFVLGHHPISWFHDG